MAGQLFLLAEGAIATSGIFGTNEPATQASRAARALITAARPVGVRRR